MSLVLMHGMLHVMWLCGICGVALAHCLGLLHTHVVCQLAFAFSLEGHFFVELFSD